MNITLNRLLFWFMKKISIQTNLTLIFICTRAPFFSLTMNFHRFYCWTVQSNQKFNIKVRKVNTFSMGKTMFRNLQIIKKIATPHIFLKPWKPMPVRECYCTHFKYLDKHLFTLATELHGKVKSPINQY